MNTTFVSVRLVLAFVVIGLTSDALAALPARSVATTEARTVITRYFTALETGHFRTACGLLGRELRAQSGGPSCPSFLRFGMPDPLVWKVLGSRPSGDGVGIRLRVSQNELDHVRMRTWLAIVRLEEGVPRIVETRLLN